MSRADSVGVSLTSDVPRGLVVYGSLLLFVVACSSGSPSSSATSSQSPEPSSSTVAPMVVHPLGSVDVVLQVDDYHLGWGPAISVTGPEIVIYGDGSVYAELFDGIEDRQAKYRRVTGHMSEEQLQSLLRNAEVLPTSPTQGSLPVDTFAILMVAGTHEWGINDTSVEPFASYLAGVRSLVRSVATTAWEPTRWIVRPFGATQCSSVTQAFEDPTYDAPVYPHVLDRYPLGNFDC